jgi:hypothetical protein
MLVNGRASTNPTSSSEPMPMNTMQAMKPLLNVSVYTGCKPVDAQDVHQVGGIFHGIRRCPGLRLHKQGSQTAMQIEGVEVHDGGVYRGHPQAHRDHDQRLEHSLASQIHEQETEEDQPDSRGGDRRGHIEQRGGTLKNLLDRF